MKSKTLRILVVAICSIVIIAEAVLLAVIFGKKSNTVKAEDGTDGYYPVKRVVRCTTRDMVKEYKYDKYGRLMEVYTNGLLRQTLPLLRSGFGERRELYFYDASGKLVRVQYTENESEWEAGEEECKGMILINDTHGGVSYMSSPNFALGPTYQIVYMDEESMTELIPDNPESYGEDGRIIEKEYRYGFITGRRSRFTYDGNTVYRTDYDDEGKVFRTCRFEYDNHGRLVLAAEEKNGHDTDVIRYEYDAKGNLIVEDHQGNETHKNYQIRYTYDQKGNLLKEEEDETYGENFVKEEREYETVLVKEEYLTDEERKSLGLSYDPAWVEEDKPLLDIKSWNLTDDLKIIY